MINYREFIGYKGSDSETIRKELRDATSRQRTASLFAESVQAPTRESGYSPYYSLREYENEGLPSAYHVYMHSIDEADAALKLVGSYSHWRKLCSLQWFINGSVAYGFEGLAQWRKDMSERDKTAAKTVLLEQMADGNITAAKALDKIARDDEKEANKILPKRYNKEKATPQDAHIVNFMRDFKDR